MRMVSPLASPESADDIPNTPNSADDIPTSPKSADDILALSPDRSRDQGGETVPTDPLQDRPHTQGAHKALLTTSIN